MSQNCVVTFTWMIMGHGLVLRYFTDKSILLTNPNSTLATEFDERKKRARFIPKFDINHPMEVKKFWDNTHYISLSDPHWYAISDAGNSWQAHEMMFQEIYGISAYSQDKIEREIVIIETAIHRHLRFTWSIFENVIPWEKTMFGYHDEEDKNFLENKRGRIFRDGRNYVFNNLWDPGVGVSPIGGGFCRLMLINVTNGKDPSRNYYYGDKSNFEDTGSDDIYGFEIPDYQIFLSEIGEKCWQNSQLVFENHKHQLGDLGNDCSLRMCIYDGTCNSYAKWIKPNIQQELKEENFRKITAAKQNRSNEYFANLQSRRIGGGVQYGGDVNIQQEMAELERILKEQSESMKKTVDDPYNVNLNIIMDLKEIAEKENEGSAENESSSSSSSSSSNSNSTQNP